MSLLNIAISGDLEQYQRDEIALTKKANLYALKVGSETLRRNIAAATGKFGDRLAKTWKARVYANGGTAPAAMVYSKAPRIISAMMADTVILPKKGRYLAIPTDYNRSQGKAGGKVMVSPKQMIDSGLSFTRPRKGGPGLIWFLSVPRASKMSRADQVKLFGRGGYRRIRDAIGSARMYAKTQVPMFTLVPQVHLTKKLDLQPIVDRVQDQLPSFLSEGYDFYDTGGSA